MKVLQEERALDRIIDRYPDLIDIRERCRRRVPRFVWDYFDSATGRERMRQINRLAFDSIKVEPSVLHGNLDIDLGVNFLNQCFSLPFGIAPVGMSGLIYPDSELVLCEFGRKSNIPYCLSTVAAMSPERLAENAIADDVWFQLYPPRDLDILRSLIDRVEKVGIKTLVLTLDLPGPSVRERQLRAGLTIPPRVNASMVMQSVMKPSWGIRRLRAGLPKLECIERYSDDNSSRSSTGHIGYLMRTAPDERYLHKVRDLWPGTLIAKGLTTTQSLRTLEGAGVDAIWVSNHAGRQFESGISSIESLRSVRSSTKLPIIFDSGVETGLDIIKAYMLGANFVMMGRSWHYALGAFGHAGPDVLAKLLQRDLMANLTQMGLSNLRSF